MSCVVFVCWIVRFLCCGYIGCACFVLLFLFAGFCVTCACCYLFMIDRFDGLVDHGCLYAFG